MKISFKEVYSYLEQNKRRKSPTNITVIECSCNILELKSFIEKQNIKILNDYPISTIYSCRDLVLPKTYKTVPKFYYLTRSDFGHMKFVYCINMFYIIFTTSKKENLNFTIAPYEYSRNDVFFDIETTGLNPLFDDVLSIALFQPSTGKSFHKYLPLEKQSFIPEEAYDINGITEDMIKGSNPLRQQDVDVLIEYFKLDRNRLTIWTGKNLFDALFLNCYFVDHNLTDYGLFEFQNARDAAKQLSYFEHFRSFSKDNIARMFLIDTAESHTSLGDCKIEAQIAEEIHKGTIPQIPNWNKILEEMSDNFILMTKLDCEKLYEKLCCWCTISNGPVLQDYDKNPHKRGKEFIDIHHMDETEIADIAARTYDAKKSEDFDELEYLSQHNRKNRLCYAHKSQHFLLHCLIAKIRGGGGGPHMIYANMICFGLINPYLRKIYAQLLMFENDDFLLNAIEFWQSIFKENNYKSSNAKYEIEQLTSIIKELKSK